MRNYLKYLWHERQFAIFKCKNASPSIYFFLYYCSISSYRIWRILLVQPIYRKIQIGQKLKNTNIYLKVGTMRGHMQNREKDSLFQV